ncbi:hypothetical protein NEOLEDRAFT_1184393 [Neolentinus lepideus HHB14362 ss-1]|uniref:Uncharacterized protein n=1 Tax=Neolentinus lepideus HHB14362 ss-1 TaxID=1314782 RepID=A0A165MH21_9AGAM|nr:hypothetical protein NEOLEDRAFT_1184393 [Neolentinus lepideus HHB14362 ss-1]
MPPPPKESLTNAKPEDPNPDVSSPSNQPLEKLETEPVLDPAPAPVLARRARTKRPLSEPVERPKRDRKPSRYVRDLTSGEGSTSAKPADPSVPVGLQVPSRSVTIEDVPDEGDEAGGVEYALVAETSEVEAAGSASRSQSGSDVKCGKKAAILVIIA